MSGWRFAEPENAREAFLPVGIAAGETGARWAGGLDLPTYLKWSWPLLGDVLGDACPIDLRGVRVVESTAIPRGTMYVWRGDPLQHPRIVGHPLDIIAMKHGRDLDARLDEAIDWIVARGAARIAEAIDALIALDRFDENRSAG